MVVLFNEFQLTYIMLSGIVSHLIIKNDGDLVIYDKYNQTLESVKTNGKGDHLIIQDDSNLVIYDSHKEVLWKINAVFSKLFLNI